MIERPKLRGRVCRDCGAVLSRYTANHTSSRYCYRCGKRTCGERLKNGKLCGKETAEREQRCAKHGGSKLFQSQWDPPSPQASSIFNPEFQTAAKALARVDLYRNMRERLKKFTRTPSFLLLPGGDPVGEIQTIRSVFGDAVKITAFDRSGEACKRALAAGASEAVVGELDQINSWDARECLRRENWDFVNLDFCGILKADNLEAAQRAALRSGGWFSVFMSYGFDKLDWYKWELRRWRAVVETQGKQNDPWVQSLESIPEPVLMRVLTLATKLQYSGPGWQLERVYIYRGHRMPMFGAVFSHFCSTRFWDPFVVKISGTSLRERVLEETKTHSTDELARLYGIEPRTIIAWKAVQTRREREKSDVQG